MKILFRTHVGLLFFVIFVLGPCIGSALAAPATASSADDEPVCDVSEEIVAGGPENYMEVRHLILSGSQSGIGAILAQIAHQRHGVKPWHKLNPRITRLQADYFKRI